MSPVSVQLREAASSAERSLLLDEIGVLGLPQALQGLDERLGNYPGSVVLKKKEQLDRAR
ncbi:MAG: hypothetical protein JO023_10495 [Chloroflexi bacterium]|nr:hypothetical protein [Chloroflexota bacterium]